MRLAFLTITALAANAASANVSVSFLEGAPKDKFVIENRATCDLGPSRVTIDLSGSAAGLIFDTSAAGAGVEVFQPLEIIAGEQFVKELSVPTDGDTAVTVSLTNLPAKTKFSFTIDVDDTLANSQSGQIIVRGNEISGAVADVAIGSKSSSSTFGKNAKSLVMLDNC